MDEATREGLGKALGKVASGLFIVTSRFEERTEGMLGSWLTQAGFEPPMITVAVAKSRGIRLLIESSESFVVNVVGEESGELMKPFYQAPAPGEDPFVGLATRPCEEAGGAPILEDALAWFACGVQEGVHGGDHVIYLAEVLAGEAPGAGRPKTHVRDSGFHY